MELAFNKDKISFHRFNLDFLMSLESSFLSSVAEFFQKHLSKIGGILAPIDERVRIS